MFIGFAPGRPSRTFIQDLDGGVAKPVTPEDVEGMLVSPDGTLLIAGRQLYPLSGGDPQPIAGLAPEDRIVRWTEDGSGLLLGRVLNSPTVEITAWTSRRGSGHPSDRSRYLVVV